MKEAADYRVELEEMRSDESKTESDLRAQRNAIDETERVIADIRPRLVDKFDEVKALVQEIGDEAGSEDEELLQKSKEYLSAAEDYVND